eukprot:765-Heterococcus_DN1.PRE.3
MAATPDSSLRPSSRNGRVPALPAVEDGSSSNTKARLSNILNSFQDFDQSMKVGVRQRKAKDEHRVAQLTTELTRLEKLLNVEIKRRVELNKSIQTWAESEIDKVTGTFKEMIVDRSQVIHSRMEQVVDKIDGLEQRFASEMAKIPIDITQRAEHLTAMLVRSVKYPTSTPDQLQHTVSSLNLQSRALIVRLLRTGMWPAAPLISLRDTANHEDSTNYSPAAHRLHSPLPLYHAHALHTALRRSSTKSAAAG